MRSRIRTLLGHDEHAAQPLWLRYAEAAGDSSADEAARLSEFLRAFAASSRGKEVLDDPAAVLHGLLDYIDRRIDQPSARAVDPKSSERNSLANTSVDAEAPPLQLIPGTLLAVERLLLDARHSVAELESLPVVGRVLGIFDHADVRPLPAAIQLQTRPTQADGAPATLRDICGSDA